MVLFLRFCSIRRDLSLSLKKFIKFHTNFPKLSQIHPNSSKLIKIYSNSSKLVQMHQNPPTSSSLKLETQPNCDMNYISSVCLICEYANTIKNHKLCRTINVGDKLKQAHVEACCKVVQSGVRDALIASCECERSVTSTVYYVDRLISPKRLKISVFSHFNYT